jgi:DNA polymerase-3 subunit delta
MPGIAMRRAKRHKLSMGHDEAQALAVTVGTDLGLLERAFEKLALVADDGVVTIDLISTHVSDTRLEDAFGLARAVATGDRKDALSCLARLQASRESDPIQLVGMLAWQLRQLMRARARLDDGVRPDDIGRELNQYRERLTALLNAARRLDARGHTRRLARLAEADRTLKSSRAPGWVVMVALISDLCPAPR